MPIFPLFALFTQGRRDGTVITIGYLALATVILFVPDLPGVASYPTPLAVRLLAASVFTAVVAFYNEY